MRHMLLRAFAQKKADMDAGKISAFLHYLTPQPPEGYDYRGTINGKELFTDGQSSYFFAKSIYHPGEIIYIREEWAIDWDERGEPVYVYRADGTKMPHWKAGSYMPVEAARVWLEVTGAEIVQFGTISRAAAKALGASGRDYRAQVRDMWDRDLRKNQGKMASDQNPWLQLVCFRMIDRPEGIPSGINDRILAHATNFNQYTFRLADSGEMVAQGTAEQCAEAMGFSGTSRIYTLLAQIRAGENTKYTAEVTLPMQDDAKKRGWLRDCPPAGKT